MSQAHEKGHYRELPEGEATASIRKTLTRVAAIRQETVEGLTKLLQKVGDPEQREILEKVIRETRRGPGGVKP